MGRQRLGWGALISLQFFNQQKKKGNRRIIESKDTLMERGALTIFFYRAFTLGLAKIGWARNGVGGNLSDPAL